MWSALKGELKKQLAARSKDDKTLSIAPVGNLNKVTDLSAAPDASGGQATLTWTEVLGGDYNNDGEVSIADLGPLALYFGLYTNSGPDDPHKLVDSGDGNPRIDIDDLQPIAGNYMAHLQGYQVWRGHWNGATTDWEGTPRPNANPANPNWSVDRPATIPVSTRPSYTYTDDISGLPDKSNIRYKVTACGDGAPGEDSDEAVMPPPVVPTYSVSGAVTSQSGGLPGVVLTLTPGGLSSVTQAGGTYVIVGVSDGSYTLMPSIAGYTFTPLTRSVMVAGGSVSGQDFFATAIPSTHAVSGTVKLSGSGLSGVTMTLSPGGHAAATGADGTFSIGGVPDGDYTLTPTKTEFAFVPAARSVTVSGADVAAQDFTASSVYGLGDTPWPKFRRDSACSGLSTYVGAQTNAIRWTCATGNWVQSSPAIGPGGTVYVGSDDGKLYALDPADGAPKWTYAAGGAVASSPAVAADGTVYVGSDDGNVYALDPADGSVKWMCATGGPVRSSPAIGPDGSVYIGSEDYKVYALSPADGRVKWSYATANYVLSSPAIAADGTVYVGSLDGNLYALDSADGGVKWIHHTGNFVDASPAVGPDGTVYVGSADHNVYALSAADGSVEWWFATLDRVESSAAVGPDGTVYVGSDDGKVYALNSVDGGLKWEYQTGIDVESSPALGADGTVYVGSRSFKVYALNSWDGSVKWEYATGENVFSSPAVGANGTVYVGSDDGKLYAFGS
jgi:hypothetical protein